MSFVISLLFGRGLYLFRGVINETRIRLQKASHFPLLHGTNNETFFSSQANFVQKKKLSYGTAENFSVHYFFIFFIVSSTTMEPLFFMLILIKNTIFKRAISSIKLGIGWALMTWISNSRAFRELFLSENIFTFWESFWQWLKWLKTFMNMQISQDMIQIMSFDSLVTSKLCVLGEN